MTKEKLKIEKLFCFISEDDDGEGVVAMFRNGSWYPMAGADMARVDDLLPIAKYIANNTNQKLELLEFTTRKEIQTIKPDKDLN